MESAMVSVSASLRFRVLALLLLFCSFPSFAQFVSWDDFVEQLFLEAEDEETSASAENLIDDYIYLHTHPININSADSVELQQLMFLTDRQISGICRYINRYGALHGVGELMLVPELDYHTRQLLSYFITFGEPGKDEESLRDTWHRMLTQGRSELYSRTDIPLYKRAGYAPRTQSELDASPSRYYTGNALYHNLRYNYRYKTNLSWGVSAEKDAGEPLFTSAAPLPDYLSGYVQLSDMGILKNLVAGNYRLSFGQGLILNSDFTLGKTMVLQGMGRKSVSVKPHRGTGESDYYTGAAATLEYKSWQFTTFASYRSIDATLDGEAISTLKTDGYHRTPLEQAKRGNTHSNLFGAHLAYSSHGVHLGLTAMYQSFNRTFALPKQGYKHYFPQGSEFFNTSVDYAWHHHRLSIAGETAMDIKGSVATLNMLRIKAADKLHFTLLQRYYPHDFWALESNSFSSSADVRNEQGIYLGAEWQPNKKSLFSAYIDGYHFPYLRYQVSAPSYGTDGVVSARYKVSENHSIQLRYRFRMRQRDVAEGYHLAEGILLNEWTHRVRAQWSGTLTPLWSCQALAEGCFVQAETQSLGTMASIQATCSPIFGNNALHFSGGFTAFNADYATRLYGYERGLLYAYNYQMYHGEGIRSYLIAQYKHKELPRLTATIKLGATYYFDRPTLNSGAAMIDACHREDVQVQIDYKF